MDLKEMFENAGPDEKDSIMSFAAFAGDMMVSTNQARRHFRETVKDRPDVAKAFDCICMRYDLNQTVVQFLGNIKAMLEKFDPNDFSSKTTSENLKLHKNISALWAISVQNINDQLGALMKLEDEINENRNGGASG